MSRTETITIDVYPWPEPSEEQRRRFDALAPAEQRALIAAEIEAGFASGTSDRSIAEIIAEARADLQESP